MSRWKCLMCSRVLSDKYTHIRRTSPSHTKYIQIGTEGEEELSPTQRWTNEILSDEIEGMKRMMIKISTHKAITEISTQRSGATYDDIILAALDSYKREQEIGPQTDPLENIVKEEE